MLFFRCGQPKEYGISPHTGIGNRPYRGREPVVCRVRVEPDLRCATHRRAAVCVDRHPRIVPVRFARHRGLARRRLPEEQGNLAGDVRDFIGRRAESVAVVGYQPPLDLGRCNAVAYCFGRTPEKANPYPGAAVGGDVRTDPHLYCTGRLTPQVSGQSVCERECVHSYRPRCRIRYRYLFPHRGLGAVRARKGFMGPGISGLATGLLSGFDRPPSGVRG